MEEAIPEKIIIENKSIGVGIDKNNTEWYLWEIIVKTENSNQRDSIESIKYHLHPSFNPNVIEIKDKASDFKLISKGWGEFDMKIEIILKNGKRTIINHYLSLDTSKIHETIKELNDNDFTKSRIKFSSIGFGKSK